MIVAVSPHEPCLVDSVGQVSLALSILNLKLMSVK